MNRSFSTIKLVLLFLTGITLYTISGKDPALHITTEQHKIAPMHLPQSFMRERHFYDRGSPYNLSYGLQQENRNIARALLNDPKQCASWTESDFFNALMTLYGRALPINHHGNLPYTMKEMCRDDTYIYYLNDAHRFAILGQWQLYNYENFWQFLRCFSDYERCISTVYDFLQDYSDHQHYVSPTVLQRIYAEHNAIQQRQNHGNEAQEKIDQEKQQHLVRETYHECSQDINNEHGEWHELCNVYARHNIGDSSHLNSRIDALRDITTAGEKYSNATYVIDNQVSQLLMSHGYRDEEYKHFYGNQLQHVLHQECVTLLGKVTLPSAPPFVRREVVADLVGATHEYNKHGFVHKACQISDLCWSLFDYGSALAKNTALGIYEIAGHTYEYGQAVLEGGLQGLLMAADDAWNHPLQTVACAVAGGYVLAYQLSKVVYNLLDIGTTSLFDRGKAKEKWNDYITPVTMMIHTISKQQMTLRDAVKNGAALVVCWKAQSKLLEGTNKLYCGIRDSALEFASKNLASLPEQYMTTTDGVMLKATHDMHFESLQKVPTQGNLPTQISIFETNAKHIFRNALGHLPDTPEARKMLMELVSNQQNYLGVDAYGNHWFAKMLCDGQQIWASVRGNLIRNGGLNTAPRIFNTTTGLCNP